MEKLFTFNDVELYTAGVLFFLFVVLLLYYLVTYARPLRMSKIQQRKKNDNQPAVSVIVYSLNESENLSKHLPILLAQDYPEYEVIVVNDGSTDESEMILKLLENQHKHLYHTYIPENVKYLSRKKLALTVGIKAAKHDILLFLDADCKPISKNWIASMARNYSPETTIVLGYCAYGNHKGFLHKLIAYDNLINGLQYLSSALKNHPFSGNGKNLSYRKELFFQHKGYYKSLALHAGEDDLFVNESASRINTKVEYSPDSITEMEKIERFKIWKSMKISRAATQKYYKGGTLTFYKTVDFVFFFFLLTVIASIAYSCFYGSWLIGILGFLLYLIRLIIKTIVFHKSAKMLHQKPLGKHLFMLELVLPLYNMNIWIYRLFKGKNDYTFRFDK